MHQGKVRSFMSIPDKDHINRVLLWMSYADEDLVLANYAKKMPGIHSYRLIAFHAQQWSEKIKNAEELTPFAVTTRYPMLDEKVTENEAVEAVNLASRVRQVVRSTLAEEGINLEEDASK
jgi:HEPN domain-containing protein